MSQTVNTFLNKSFLPSHGLGDFVPVSGIILRFVHYPSRQGGVASKGSLTLDGCLIRNSNHCLTCASLHYLMRETKGIRSHTFPVRTDYYMYICITAVLIDNLSFVFFIKNFGGYMCFLFY